MTDTDLALFGVGVITGMGISLILFGLIFAFYSGVIA